MIGMKPSTAKSCSLTLVILVTLYVNNGSVVRRTCQHFKSLLEVYEPVGRWSWAGC